jgi:hypothetical protein
MIDAMIKNDGIMMAQKTIPSNEVLIVRKMISPKHRSPAGRMRVDSHVKMDRVNARNTKLNVVLFLLLATTSSGGFRARTVMSSPKII